MNCTPNTLPRKEPIPAGRAVITLTCAGIGPPLVIRVRRALKGFLRAHGLKCESVDLQATGDTPQPTHGDLDGGELVTGNGEVHHVR